MLHRCVKTWCSSSTCSYRNSQRVNIPKTQLHKVSKLVPSKAFKFLGECVQVNWLDLHNDHLTFSNHLTQYCLDLFPFLWVFNKRVYKNEAITKLKNKSLPNMERKTSDKQYHGFEMLELCTLFKFAKLNYTLNINSITCSKDKHHPHKSKN